MLIKLVQVFTKITAWLAQFICFRTKIYYEDRKKQGRHIRGKAIVISNHTSVYDFAVMMFVFISRTLRCQVAELIFNKKPLGTFIRLLGGIRVDRNTHDFSFLSASEQILREGGVLEIYPESRIPRVGEERPLEFKPSAAYLALSTGVKVIPVYTNGSYFSRKRARVIIGEPLDPMDYCDENLSEKENIAVFNDVIRQKIISLEVKLNEQIGSNKKEV